MPFKTTFQTYYRLTKPGIIYGNALPAVAGFFLASANVHQFDASLLLAMLLGTSLVIGAACVVNNYIDRGIDAKMTRTKQRALVSGTVSGRNALIFASLLAIIGFYLLIAFTNALTVVIGVIGLFFYVVLYGIAKRRSVHGTLIGSVAGATPPLAGYVAVTNHFDLAAVGLFLILVCWQMAHFFAIAMYRRDDYASAGIPVLPVVKGMKAARTQVLVYVVLFILACSILFFGGYAGYCYLTASTLLGLAWLWYGLRSSARSLDHTTWARKMFFFSLIVIFLISLFIALGGFLP